MRKSNMPAFRNTHARDQALTQSTQDYTHSLLAQNVALLLLDKGFESVDAPALHALTAIMSDYLTEMAG